MKLFKLTIAALLSFTLSGCFHIQLKGSVGDASLTIAPLRTPGEIIDSATSGTPQALRDSWGEEKWASQSAFVKLLFTGIAELESADIDPDTLYLATASGGMDFDPELNQELSDTPVTVQGSWHAIVSGQRILDGNLKVSALTEALYQQQLSRLDDWSDSEVRARLDAAAQLVVGDADKSGSVDYDDVLRWNRTLDGKYLLSDLAAVDQLSDAIIAGQPADMLASKAEAVLGSAQVLMEFDAGIVTVETLNWGAPITAANFLNYVRDGFYDQMLVHRAINNFMIQMGYLEYLGANDEGRVQWEVKSPGPAIVNESSNGLSNVRGTLAMARTSDPDSASSQFFINQVNNFFLDYGSSGNPDGYAVFARVLSGMSVVDDIAAERTTTISGIGRDVPTRGVVLQSVQLQQVTAAVVATEI